MNQAYQIHDQSAPHFLTFQIIDWIDVLSRKSYRDIVIESMKFCATHKKLEIYAYVIMTNHMHVIWRAENNDLSDAIRDFKKLTARKIIEAIQQGPESRQDWMLKRFEFAARKN